MNFVLFLFITAGATVLGLMPLCVLLLLSIGIHEYMHFITAKKSGCMARGIMIGFGPTAIAFRKVQGKWEAFFPKGNQKVNPDRYDKDSFFIDLNLFLIGGGCVFHDDEFDSLSPKDRIWSLIAGPFINIVIGFVLIAGVLISWNGFQKGVTGAVTVCGKVIPLMLTSLKSAVLSSDTVADSVQGIGNAVKNMPAGTAAGYLVLISGLINYLIGVFNLIPIPGLDGGQAVFVIPELFGKHPNKKLISRVSLVCIAVFAVLTFAMIGKDLILMAIR